MVKRGVIGIFLVFAFALISFASAAHPTYPSFSEATFTINNNALSISDDIIYNTGYYSANGGSWQQFSLQGTAYGDGQPFLVNSGTGSVNLPGSGTHYVIVFSCTLVNNDWDCHENKWQLSVVNNGGNNNNNNGNGGGTPTQGSHTCGDGNCNNGETCSLCRIDCGACTLSNYDSYPSATTCGDGVCDVTEYCSVCSADCGSCPEIECPCDNGYECVNNVCLQRPTGSGERLFVAVGGNGNGAYSNPFGSWETAFNAMGPGDVVYIRGGVYMMPNRNDGYRIDRSGTSSNRITISNYPGERPVLDLGQASLGDVDDASQGYASCGHDDNIRGLSFRRSSYLTIRGLEIRNLWQRDGCDSITGFSVGGTDILVENMVVHDIGGNCFSTGNYDIIVRNSDAYHCVDYITTTPSPSAALPGNDGTGFGDGSWKNTGADVSFYGNRAWNNGDQGFSSGSLGHNEYDSCWSMHNGVLEGGGHGFKMGWISQYTPGLVNRLYDRCIASNNWAQGFDTNDGGYAGGILHVFNNFAYHNGENHGGGYGFRLLNSDASDELERQKRTYRNNIAYGNDGPVGTFGDYTHSQNSWDSGVSLSDGDFQSLNVGQLYRPRNSDGSLPSITFGKPVSGSDLIDQNVYVG